MVFILGASSLDHVLRKFPAPSQKRVRDICFTKPGLCLNFNARDSRKTVRYYRSGTEDIEESLGSTGILVLNVVKDFISKRKAKDQVLIEKYKQLHQHLSLELKTLLLLRR